jgi:hypothetical protein
VRLNVERPGHVVAQELEVIEQEQVADIVFRTRKEVIDTQYVASLLREAIAKMGA